MSKTIKKHNGIKQIAIDEKRKKNHLKCPVDRMTDECLTNEKL